MTREATEWIIAHTDNIKVTERGQRSWLRFFLMGLYAEIWWILSLFMQINYQYSDVHQKMCILYFILKEYWCGLISMFKNNLTQYDFSYKIFQIATLFAFFKLILSQIKISIHHQRFTLFLRSFQQSSKAALMTIFSQKFRKAFNAINIAENNSTCTLFQVKKIILRWHRYSNKLLSRLSRSVYTL